MKSPSVPPPPDPMATASAQAGMNRDTALATNLFNMTDQYTPDGELRYQRIGSIGYTGADGKKVSIPRFKAVQKLTPAQQNIYNIGQQTETNLATIGRDQSGRIGSLLATPMNFDGVPEIRDSTMDRDKVENALMARMQPRLDQDRAALETQLVNRGVRAGSAAYDDAVRNADMAVNDARLGAILGAGQEQSRLFGMDMSARQQGIQEVLTERNQPINEISALLSQSQVSMPQFVNTPQTQVGGVDYMGMVRDNYNAQVQAAQQKAQSQNAMLGGLFGLAGTIGTAGIKYSDRRLKTDIKIVGKLENGLNVYSYRYTAGGPYEIGLMADEVRAVNPDAVTNINGFDAVDYRAAVGGE